MSSSSRPLVTPYLAVIRLTTRQLQLIAEHKLTQDDISLVKNDYALAINRHFHQRSIHQVILSPPGAAKSYYGRVSPEGLHFYAHSVVPSVNGKSPQVNRDIWHHALMDFLLGFPAEVQSEFSKLGVGVIRWPKYFNEPEWLYEDMYKTIHAAKNAQQKVQGEFEFSCESQQRVQDTQSTYIQPSHLSPHTPGGTYSFSESYKEREKTTRYSRRRILQAILGHLDGGQSRRSIGDHSDFRCTLAEIGPFMLSGIREPVGNVSSFGFTVWGRTPLGA